VLFYKVESGVDNELWFWLLRPLFLQSNVKSATTIEIEFRVRDYCYQDPAKGEMHLGACEFDLEQRIVALAHNDEVIVVPCPAP
jgi:hypothetical protein